MGRGKGGRMAGGGAQAGLQGVRGIWGKKLCRGRVEEAVGGWQAVAGKGDESRGSEGRRQQLWFPRSGLEPQPQQLPVPSLPYTQIQDERLFHHVKWGEENLVLKSSKYSIHTMDTRKGEVRDGVERDGVEKVTCVRCS